MRGLGGCGSGLIGKAWEGLPIGWVCPGVDLSGRGGTDVAPEGPGVPRAGVLPRSWCEGAGSLPSESLVLALLGSLSFERAAGVAGVEPRFSTVSSLLSVGFGVPLLYWYERLKILDRMADLRFASGLEDGRVSIELGCRSVLR